MKELDDIQQELIAPKDLHNTFGNFDYRSTEGILKSLKPLLLAHKVSLTITDDIVAIGNSNYVKATITIKNGTESEVSTGFAKEADSKKGMDAAQLTGATSSYARKYALNAMFLIDDSKDLDGLDNTLDTKRKELPQAKSTWVLRIEACKTAAELQTVSNDAWHWAKTPAQKTEISNCKDAMKLKLGIQ